MGILGTGCSEDFLDKTPQDLVSAKDFFKKPTDLKTYVNAMYARLATQYISTGGSGNSNLRLDNGSDIMIIQTAI